MSAATCSIPDLPPPGDLGSLLGSGKVGYPRPAAPMPAARVLHVLSPFAPVSRIDRIWPRWAHEQGLRFCVTVYDPIPGHISGSSLAELRDGPGARRCTARYSAAADALLTISPATEPSLWEQPRHRPGSVAHGRLRAQSRCSCAPAASREKPSLAQASCPLEPSLVLCPATGASREPRTAHRRLRPPARAVAQFPSTCVCAGSCAQVRTTFRHVAAPGGIATVSCSPEHCRPSHAPPLPAPTSSAFPRSSALRPARRGRRWRAEPS